MKSGFISIIGRPNVGKSTLLNGILGEKIAITTNKPQTTRNTIRGILTDEEAQLVFIDTPGIHRPRTGLGEYMTDAALKTLDEVDAILFLVDEEMSKGPGDLFILERLEKVDTPVILIINKMDTMEPDRYARIVKEYEKKGKFEEIIGVSALKNINLDVVVKAVKKQMKEGPTYFPEDMMTDRPERFLAGEIIREKLLLYLQDEIPHGVAVEIEKYDEVPGITKISAVIYCEKKSHKGIIIGRDGRKLKGVGKSARKDIEVLLGCKVFLELWVKVKENWRNSDFILSNLGYKDA